MDKDTMRRTVEVVFFINLKGFTPSFETKQVIESLADLFNCKPSVINMAYQNMQNATHAPSKGETVVALKLLGFGTRKIGRILSMHTNTVYQHLHEYEEAGAIGLAPRFDLKTDQELLKFNRALHKAFGGASQMFEMKGGQNLWK